MADGLSALAELWNAFPVTVRPAQSPWVLRTAPGRRPIGEACAPHSVLAEMRRRPGWCVVLLSSDAEALKAAFTGPTIGRERATMLLSTPPPY